jgi:hypothetical protein
MNQHTFSKLSQKEFNKLSPEERTYELAKVRGEAWLSIIQGYAKTRTAPTSVADTTDVTDSIQTDVTDSTARR